MRNPESNAEPGSNTEADRDEDTARVKVNVPGAKSGPIAIGEQESRSLRRPTLHISASADSRNDVPSLHISRL
jgi:hypothetical protein